MKEDIKTTELKKRNSKILIGAIIFLAFTFGWAFGHLDYQRQGVGYSPTVNKDAGGRANFDLFWQVWDKITTSYDGEVDYQKLIYGAIDGMVKAVGDPYSSFYTPEQTEKFQEELEGSISGIGAEIGIKNNQLTIIAPMENSPAIKSGLKAQDVILNIDDTDAKDLDLNTAVSKIRGQEGTKVKIVIKRGNEELTFDITREKIDIKSVKWEVKEGNIGYIEVSRFDSNTANLVKEAARELKNKKVKGVILDLRNNPGGYLDSAINVGSEFIKSGKIVVEKRIKGNKREDYLASGKGNLTDPDIKLIVLVNGGSASASEIVAGAIQDHNRGLLIGEKTFGKGSVQSVENIGPGASLHLTIAHWYTPNDKNLSTEGLTPNIEVKMTEEDVNANKDPQLDKAMKEIMK